MWGVKNSRETAKQLYSVRGLERSELGGSHGCPGRLWDRFLWQVYTRTIVGMMLWTDYRPVIIIGPKAALGSREIRPIRSAPSLGQCITKGAIREMQLWWVAFIFVCVGHVWTCLKDTYIHIHAYMHTSLHDSRYKNKGDSRLRKSKVRTKLESIGWAMLRDMVAVVTSDILTFLYLEWIPY